MTRRRVVVTGLGAVTPAGNDIADTWSNIVAGRSGIGLIDSFDVTGYASRIGGTIRNLDLSRYLAPRDARRMDPFIHYGLVASIQAIGDAELEVTEANAERIGACIGSGIGGLPGIEKGHDTLLAGGPRKVSPFFVPPTSSTWWRGTCPSDTASRDPRTASSLPAPPVRTASGTRRE